MHLTPYTPADAPLIQAWPAEAVIEPPDTTRPNLAWIVRLGDGTPVGWVELFNIDLGNLKAEAGIGIYDERGKGLALFAGRSLLRHAWALGLHRVYVRIPASKRHVARIVERLGFRSEGTEAEAWLHDGTYEDVLRYSMIRPKE